MSHTLNWSTKTLFFTTKYFTNYYFLLIYYFTNTYFTNNKMYVFNFEC